MVGSLAIASFATLLQVRHVAERWRSRYDAVEAQAAAFGDVYGVRAAGDRAGRTDDALAASASSPAVAAASRPLRWYRPLA